MADERSSRQQAAQASSHRLITLALAAALAASCTNAPTATGAGKPRKPGAVTPKAEASAAPRATAGPEAPTSPTPAAGSGLASPPAGLVTGAARGRVLGLDGLPAAGVRVVARMISDHGAGLVSNNSAGLVGNNGGTLLGNNGGTLVANGGGTLVANGGAQLTGKTKYGLAQATDTLETVTDAEGRFGLTGPTGASLTVEAIRDESVKAIRLGVAADATDLELRLAFTGTLAGRITAPALPAIKDFEGVDVYIPGTAYVAKAAADGRFTIANVPAGVFAVVARKAAVGRAEAASVEVKPKEATDLTLALESIAPALTALKPASGRPGAVVTLTGARFGVSSGAALTVSIGGAAATTVEKVDDATLRVTIPPGAVSGDVVVTADGAASNALAFSVVKPRVDVKTETLAGASTRVGNLDGLGSSASFQNPLGVAVAPDGRIFVADEGNGNIRVLTPLATAGSYEVKTYAGPVGEPVPTKEFYADGAAALARFRGPSGLALAADGTLYVADGPNHCIRAVVAEAGGVQVKTLAGHPDRQGAADGPGTAASFDEPYGLALDAAGDLLVADLGNHTLRRIKLADPAHPVSLVAGLPGEGGEANGAGDAARFSEPHALAFGPAGDLYVADTGNKLIRRVRFDGGAVTVSTLAGNSAAREGADGVGAAAAFDRPIGLTADADGNLFVTDAGEGRVRQIAFGADGAAMVTRLAGGGEAFAAIDGLAGSAVFEEPMGIAVDPFGNLVLAEAMGTRVRAVVRFDR